MFYNKPTFASNLDHGEGNIETKLISFDTGKKKKLLCLDRLFTF